MWPKGAIFCWLWHERQAGNQRCVRLQYWSYDGCKICGGSSEWPTCQTHQSTRSHCWPCFTPVQQDWNYVCLIKTQLGIQPDARFPVFLQEVHATPCQSCPTQDLSSAHSATSGFDRAPEIDEGVDHLIQPVHLPPGLLNIWLDCRTG